MRNIFLLACALLLGLVLGEGMLRLALDDVDYLQPTVAPHPVLGHVIVPGSGGHDDWGFRNPEVPEHADIVALGDSQTYGLSAVASESWPAQLARLSGKSVYNMGISGYGPPDYLYLLKNKAVELSPNVVLVGIYLGNDLFRSYEDAAGKSSGAVAFGLGHAEVFLGEFRRWLSENSMIFQVLKLQVPALTGRLRQLGEEAALAEGEIEFDGPRQRTIFEVARRLHDIDQALESNRIGLARTLEIAVDLEDVSKARGADCEIVLIPTKESVFWPLAETALPADKRARLEYLVGQEKLAHDEMVTFFEHHDIPFVDVLSALREAANEMVLYPANSDSHPLAAGYGVMAAEIYKRLSELHMLQ